MNELLKNIFVSKDIAKLSFEKGFQQWCACLFSDEHGHTPNYINEKREGLIQTDFDFKDDDFSVRNGHFVCPTHFQLIMWLHSQHNIVISFRVTGVFFIFDSDGVQLFNYKSGTYNFSTIDTALVRALELIK